MFIYPVHVCQVG